MPRERLRELVFQVRQELEMGPRGSKMALARFLGVRESRISDWLAGRRNPSGEIVLGMLEWMEDRKKVQPISWPVLRNDLDEKFCQESHASLDSPMVIAANKNHAKEIS